MNGNLFGTVINPDQIQVLNPAIVFLLIPSFNGILYPWFMKFHIFENSLQRMAVGGIIAGLAFFVAGILELALESTYPQFPDKHHSFLNIINTLPCHVRVQYLLNEDQNIQSGDILMLKSIACQNHSTYKLKMTTAFQCGFINITNTTISLQLDCLEYQVNVIKISSPFQNRIFLA